MLYELDTKEIEKSRRVPITNLQMFNLKEKDIENFLSSRLDQVVSEDKLMLIGQERSYQEEPDLLALDKDGVLYIFELKRWKGVPENILQVLRYGQKFGRFTYEEIEEFAKKHLGLENRSLKIAHKEHFDLPEVLPEQQFNHDQVFVLITDGMDSDTISAVEYWSNKGLRIKCSPYRIYNIGEMPYIQFDSYDPDNEVLPETNTSFYIVNTNRINMPNAYKDMLCIGKASVWQGREGTLRNIEKGSHVYLYHTSTGVIAKGVAASTCQKAPYKKGEYQEFFVELNFEWSVQEGEWEGVPTASEISKRLGKKLPFIRTVFSIPENTAKVIDLIRREKMERLK